MGAKGLTPPPRSVAMTSRTRPVRDLVTLDAVYRGFLQVCSELFEVVGLCEKGLYHVGAVFWMGRWDDGHMGALGVFQGEDGFGGW